MRKLRSYFFILLVLAEFSAAAQNIEYIRIPELERILNNGDNRISVVNFWATWCGPCVKEFPIFEKVAKDYDSKTVRFIMISLDFPSQVKEKLIPFLKKNNSSLSVVVMTDLDYDTWIGKVDKSWQGDIPATLVFNNAKKQKSFHSGEIDEAGLRKLINAYM